MSAFSIGKQAFIPDGAHVPVANAVATVAWLGKDGGRLAEVVDYAFVVSSYSIHRIQEAHATLVHIAWDLIHIALGEEDVV